MSTEDQAQIQDAAPERERGPLYWFIRHSLDYFQAIFQRNRKVLWWSAVLTAILALAFRASLQFLVLGLRKNLLALLLVLLWFALLHRALSRERGRFLPSLVLCLLAYGFVAYGLDVKEYIASYLRYRSLNLIELEELPLSGHERIQPLNSVYSLAHEKITESESPSMPDFVRVGEDFNWVVAIEPAYPIARAFGSVKQLYNLPGTSPSPNFAADNRISVHFDTGENLLLSHNSRSAVIRAFGPWRYLNYEPSEVMYLQNDEGRWVQVVTLIRWSGVFFPRPEFGGVVVLDQIEPSLIDSTKRVLIGRGSWIPPEEVQRHRFLRGQSLVSPKITRYAASSIRFQNGFLAPLPGYHDGDVRIPDLPSDVHNQPFVGFFALPGEVEKEGALYHYFALEPFDPAKQGLNTSLFIPADDAQGAYIYRHHLKSGTLTGVSAIAAKVMESKKIIDWNRNHPVEHRPFIREIDGKRRFFWLTTVITFKEKVLDQGNERFIAGSVPDVVLTDAAYNRSIWVNPLKQEEWVEQIRGEMKDTWAAR